MSTDLLKVVRDGSVAIVSLNRPESLNVLTSDVLSALDSTFRALKDDDKVLGIVLTGEGKSFCAGADIAAMKPMTACDASRFAELGQRVMFAVEGTGKPVIAAVNGYALGGGLELALACDFIIAADTAVFAAPEVILGILPGFGCTQRLSRLVGKGRAKEIIFSGNRVPAAEALAIGLANRVAPSGELLNEATSLMKQICSRGPVGVRLAKEVIDAGSDIDLKTACMMERDAFALCFSTEDQKEGMAAFLEKRPTQFQGR